MDWRGPHSTTRVAPAIASQKGERPRINTKIVATTPYRRNAGLIFIPGADTWHGFHKRPIQGVRKTVIMNYVTADWRARDQLAYPDTPVRL